MKTSAARFYSLGLYSIQSIFAFFAIASRLSKRARYSITTIVTLGLFRQASAMNSKLLPLLVSKTTISGVFCLSEMIVLSASSYSSDWNETSLWQSAFRIAFFKSSSLTELIVALQSITNNAIDLLNSGDSYRYAVVPRVTITPNLATTYSTYYSPTY